MTTPEKRSGFAQGLYVESATKQEELGTKRSLHDGREFVYAQIGASAIATGKLAMMADASTNVINVVPDADYAIGAKVIGLTVTSHTAVENYFEDGYFWVQDGVGEGQCYQIEASTALSSSTALSVTLKEGLRIAITAAGSECSVIQNPAKSVITSVDEENFPVGVTVRAMTALYYGWLQTKGRCAVLDDGTLTVWAMVVPGTAAGSVKDLPSTLDIDMPIVGQCLAAGETGSYAMVNLNII
jgi:hypothetical protein